MKRRTFLLVILLVAPALAFSQTEAKGTTQETNPPTHLHHNYITIAGCLTKNPPNGYELIDQRGIHNALYSSTINLDSFVGQYVTLTGERSAIPSTDTGTARPKPDFVVKKVHPASSGRCKK